MEKEHHPFLCGGIFLALLVENKYKRFPDSRENLTESALLKELTRVVRPAFDYLLPDNLATTVSNYKRCITDDSRNILFDDPGFARDFENQIEQDAECLLKGMNTFLTMCIDLDNFEKLGHALLEVIDGDKEILDSDSIYCLDKKTLVTKGALLACDTVYLSNLLLGVFYFIVTKRQGKNKEGKEIYNEWYKPVTGITNAPRKLSVDLGAEYKQSIQPSSIPIENEVNKEYSTADENENLGVASMLQNAYF